jgi:glycyl-tRNA synthetase beta chain
VTARDFLLEIGTEELPPKSLKQLMESFVSSFTEELDRAQLTHGALKGLATPRRIAILAADLADGQPEQHIERLGPAVATAFDEKGEPTKAATGFARSCNINDPRDLERVETDKGERLVYRETRSGEKLSALLPDIVEKVVRSLPIERAMRWGAHRAEFVRPVHWIVVLHGDEVLPVSLFGIGASNTTRGHRFMSEGVTSIRGANEYIEVLRSANVIVDFGERRQLIEDQVNALGEQEGASVVVDPALLDEVTALVEWPVALIGNFDTRFLEIPEEALVSAMKSHQRYFHLVDADGKLVPKFIAVANIESKSPEAVVGGNERVITPRLTDAAFFFEQDSKTSLEEKTEKLRNVVFQAKLGSYHEKAVRISKLAGFIADRIGAGESLASRAGLLCKADLVSDMVGEFPDLQGIMGGYYARGDREPEEVALAIAEHYLPTQSGGALPSSHIGQCVAIADKLDTLTGLFGIGQPPTGSRDPFALRRQALGVMRICIECKLPLDLSDCVDHAASLHATKFETAGLMEYLYERLAVFYQEHGIPGDTFNAARHANRPGDVLTDFDKRIRAIQDFRSNPSAESLAAANKRVANILKQVGDDRSIEADPAMFSQPAEKSLFEAVETTRASLEGTTSYAESLETLAKLQPVIDRYFDDVLVMDENQDVRKNRIATVAAMRSLFLTVADISMLQL